MALKLNSLPWALPFLLMGCGGVTPAPKNQPAQGQPGKAVQPFSTDRSKAHPAYRETPFDVNTKREAEARLQAAMALYKKGDRDAAEKQLKAETETAARGYPRAIAFNNYGLFMFLVGQLELAEKAMATSAEKWPDETPPQTKERLSYVVQHAQVLNALQHYAEAERVLRAGVKDREALYGIRHAGYAFGLEPLASVLLINGKVDEALKLTEECISIYREDNHARLGSAIIQRSVILFGQNKTAMLAAALAGLPNEALVEAADALLKNHGEYGAEASLSVAQECIDVLSRQMGDGHDSTMKLMGTAANWCAVSGKHELRIAMTRRILKVYETSGTKEQHTYALRALALALADAKQSAEAEECYRRAVAIMKTARNEAELSRITRDWGLQLSEEKRRPEAEALLREASVHAVNAKDKELMALADLALGIFLQHDGKLADARELLKRSVDVLPPADRYGLMGRNHLIAIEQNQACGCGDMTKAATQAFERIVKSRLPEELRGKIKVTYSDDIYNVQFVEIYKPTLEEREAVKAAGEYARFEFAKQLKERR